MLRKNARLEQMYQRGFRPSHALWVDTYNKQYGGYHLYHISRCKQSEPLLCSSRIMNSNRPIILGSYSPSQNGIIVHPKGIALCLTGGGKGHDVDKPTILLEYD